MRFRKLFPVLTVALVMALSACQQEGAEEAEEVAPADTEMMAPPAPEPMPAETMPADTMPM